MVSGYRAASVSRIASGASVPARKAPSTSFTNSQDSASSGRPTSFSLAGAAFMAVRIPRRAAWWMISSTQLVSFCSSTVSPAEN